MVPSRVAPSTSYPGSASTSSGVIVTPWQGSTPTPHLSESDKSRTGYVTDVNAHCVLLGRGTPAVTNPGNIRFRQLVQAQKERYRKAAKRYEKDMIAREIINKIHRNGGRFLRRIESLIEADALGVPAGVPAWKEVDDVMSLEKVKQALRDREVWDLNQVPEDVEKNQTGKNGTEAVKKVRHTPVRPMAVVSTMKNEMVEAGRSIVSRHEPVTGGRFETRKQDHQQQDVPTASTAESRVLLTAIASTTGQHDGRQGQKAGTGMEYPALSSLSSYGLSIAELQARSQRCESGRFSAMPSVADSDTCLEALLNSKVKPSSTTFHLQDLLLVHENRIKSAQEIIHERNQPFQCSLSDLSVEALSSTTGKTHQISWNSHLKPVESMQKSDGELLQAISQLLQDRSSSFVTAEARNNAALMEIVKDLQAASSARLRNDRLENPRFLEGLSSVANVGLKPQVVEAGLARSRVELELRSVSARASLFPCSRASELSQRTSASTKPSAAPDERGPSVTCNKRNRAAKRGLEDESPRIPPFYMEDLTSAQRQLILGVQRHIERTQLSCPNQTVQSDDEIHLNSFEVGILQCAISRGIPLARQHFPPMISGVSKHTEESLTSRKRRRSNDFPLKDDNDFSPSTSDDCVRISDYSWKHFSMELSKFCDARSARKVAEQPIRLAEITVMLLEKIRGFCLAHQGAAQTMPADGSKQNNIERISSTRAHDSGIARWFASEIFFWGKSLEILDDDSQRPFQFHSQDVQHLKPRLNFDQGEAVFDHPDQLSCILSQIAEVTRLRSVYSGMSKSAIQNLLQKRDPPVKNIQNDHYDVAAAERNELKQDLLMIESVLNSGLSGVLENECFSHGRVITFRSSGWTHNALHDRVNRISRYLHYAVCVRNKRRAVKHLKKAVEAMSK